MDYESLPNLRTRRDFFRQAACAALGTVALTSTIRDLRFINAALGQAAPVNDYKALVCIFLNGGNDSNNLVIPRGSEYANYAAIRQNLAIPQSAILPITAQGGCVPSGEGLVRSTRIPASFPGGISTSLGHLTAGVPPRRRTTSATARPVANGISGQCWSASSGRTTAEKVSAEPAGVAQVRSIRPRPAIW